MYRTVRWGHKLLAMISMHVEDLKILCQYVRQYFEKVLMPVDQAILTQAPAAGLPSIATDDDRPEQEAMVYTGIRRENIRSQPVLVGPNTAMRSLHTYPTPQQVPLGVLLDLLRRRDDKTCIDSSAPFKT